MTDKLNPHNGIDDVKYKHGNETEEEVRINLAAAYRLAALKGWDDGI
ncbi:MAG: hypothetical protein RIR27_390, partial [Pseudomonadota bacterium]